MRIKAYILPKFKNTYLDELTTAAITRWRNAFIPKEGDEETLRKARDTANRHLNSFKALLNRAYKDRLTPSDTAWRNVARFEKAGVARKVMLDSKQIKRLLENSKGGFRNLVKGLLLTGLRPGIEIEHITCASSCALTGIWKSAKAKPGRVMFTCQQRRFGFLETLAKYKTPKGHDYSQGMTANPG